MEQNDIYLDDEQASWVAAIPLITGIPITPFGGFLGGLVGRRNIMLYTHPFVIIGLIVVANAPSFAVILIGRMIISAGICSHVSSVGKKSSVICRKYFLFVAQFIRSAKVSICNAKLNTVSV